MTFDILIDLVEKHLKKRSGSARIYASQTSVSPRYAHMFEMRINVATSFSAEQRYASADLVHESEVIKKGNASGIR